MPEFVTPSGVETTSFKTPHIVPADHKWYRDYVVAQTTLGALEKLNMKWPKPKLNLAKIK